MRVSYLWDPTLPTAYRLTAAPFPVPGSALLAINPKCRATRRSMLLAPRDACSAPEPHSSSTRTSQTKSKDGRNQAQAAGGEPGARPGRGRTPNGRRRGGARRRAERREDPKEENLMKLSPLKHNTRCCKHFPSLQCAFAARFPNGLYRVCTVSSAPSRTVLQRRPANAADVSHHRDKERVCPRAFTRAEPSESP